MRARTRRLWKQLRSTPRDVVLGFVLMLAVMIGEPIAFSRIDNQARTVVMHDGSEVAVKQGYFWYAIAIIAGALLAYAFGPKPPKPKPASMEEFEVPQAREGQEYCWIFGECDVPDPTVAWWGNLINAPIRAKGGKK